MGLGLAAAGALVALLAVLSSRFSGSPAGGGNDVVKMGSGKMFDRVAPGYDLVNNVLTMRQDITWRNMMIDSLKLEKGSSVLDVGTGTAEVAMAVASHLKKLDGGKLVHSKVFGVDPSEGMIQIGREKVAKAGYPEPSVRLVIGDAEDLSTSVPPGALYDGATMAFVIRNVPDRAKAMREIAARLKGGARLAVLELGFPTFPPARWFVRHGVPFIGWLLSGGKLKQEYTYLNDSMYKFRLDDIEGLMAQAGLEVMLVKRMNFGSVGLYVGEKAKEVAQSLKVEAEGGSDAPPAA